jgi:DNA adenine methylase
MNVIEDVRPPFPYFGGKQRIADRIVAQFPEHGHYVEPYCGGLSVLAAKPRSRMETVNDLDGQLMRFWRVLRDRPDDLARACALTPHARAEHEGSRDRDVDDDIEAARRVWVAISQGRGGQLVRTGWRHFVAARQHAMGMPGYLEAYVDRMAAAAERLHHVSLDCRPALDVIASYGRDADVLLYVDPPYLGTTRGHAHSYQHEMRSTADHEALAGALDQCKATVILSGYHSPLYDELYADWHITEISASTQQGNHSAGRVQGRTEVLWSNRPIAEGSRLL